MSQELSLPDLWEKEQNASAQPHPRGKEARVFTHQFHFCWQGSLTSAPPSFAEGSPWAVATSVAPRWALTAPGTTAALEMTSVPLSSPRCRRALPQTH